MKLLDPEKQERIIKAVYKIAGSQGIDAINISQIGEEAGVATGTVYTYFKTKDELLAAAYSAVQQTVANAMYRGFDIDQPVKKVLRRIYVQNLIYRLRYYNESVFAASYVESKYARLAKDYQIRQFESLNKDLYALIEKGQKEGILVEMHPFIVASFILGSVRSSVVSLSQDFIPFKKKSIEDCFILMWKGISS